MQNPFKFISSKIVYKNEFISIKEDRVIRPNGADGIFTIVDRPTKFGVGVVAVNKSDEIYLIKQFRYAIGKYSWETPGGGVDEGETSLVGAKRELKEETGITSSNWTELISFYIEPGLITQKQQIFIAQDIEIGEVDKTHLADEGIVEVKSFRVEDIEQMIRVGDISDSNTLVGLLAYLAKKE